MAATHPHAPVDDIVRRVAAVRDDFRLAAVQSHSMAQALEAAALELVRQNDAIISGSHYIGPERRHPTPAPLTERPYTGPERRRG